MGVRDAEERAAYVGLSFTLSSSFVSLSRAPAVHLQKSKRFSRLRVPVRKNSVRGTYLLLGRVIYETTELESAYLYECSCKFTI